MELLIMQSIVKSFFGIRANDQIDLDIRHGEIHALLGENGAGKTTLMNILFGLYHADSGEILFEGKKVFFQSPSDAIQHGIGMVHQHFMLVDKMTVYQNIILGLKPPGYPFVDKQKIIQKILKISQKYGLSVEPDKKIRDLSVGEQQRVEILKSLYRDVKLLILDEPTAVLTPQETADFFKVLRALKSEGHSVILISHKLSEILDISDRVTILRDGKKVAVVDTAKTTDRELSNYMIGRDINNHILERKELTARDKILEVSSLCVSNKRNSALNNVFLDIYAGEVLGLAGVDGNGQKELVETLTGIIKADQGEITYKGRSIKKLSVRQRAELGIAYIPSDRHKDGLVLDTSLTNNYCLKCYFKRFYSEKKVMKQKYIEEKTREAVEKYKIKAKDIDSNIRLLSGGNQQKIILAREMNESVDLLIVCQPTRGLDIGASEYIRTCIMDCRNNGGGVLLVSTDLEEILLMSDRIAVMHQGKIMGILKNDPDLHLETMGLLMGGRRQEEIGV